jgi:hypothetical protein
MQLCRRLSSAPGVPIWNMVLVAAVPPATRRATGARGTQVDEMPNQIVCFALGVIAPLASVGWLIAYH